jgi:hypothetical protein
VQDSPDQRFDAHRRAVAGGSTTQPNREERGSSPGSAPRAAAGIVDDSHGRFAPGGASAEALEAVITAL